jgi:hypothetical protein
MLEHAAEAAHGIERRREASSVVAARVPVDVLNEAGEPAPPTARRMRHDRPRPRVQPCVALLVPRIDVGEPVVHTARLNVESGDHSSSSSRWWLSHPSSQRRPCGESIGYGQFVLGL